MAMYECGDCGRYCDDDVDPPESRGLELCCGYCSESKEGAEVTDFTYYPPEAYEPSE